MIPTPGNKGIYVAGEPLLPVLIQKLLKKNEVVWIIWHMKHRYHLIGIVSWFTIYVYISKNPPPGVGAPGEGKGQKVWKVHLPLHCINMEG